MKPRDLITRGTTPRDQGKLTIVGKINLIASLTREFRIERVTRNLVNASTVKRSEHPQHNCRVKARMLHLLSMGEGQDDKVTEERAETETEEKANESYETPPTSPQGGEVMMISPM